MTKQVLLGAAGIGAVALLAFGKWKLASAKPVWWVLILGGLVFMASTPARAE